MKRLLLAVAVLPLVSFGGLFPDFVDFVNSPTNILFFRGFTYNRAGTFSYTDANGTRDTLTAYVINSVRLGVQVNPSTYWVGHPTGDNEIFKSSPDIDYCVTRYYDRSRWYNLDYLPDLNESLHICCNLICSGYRSSVVEIIYDYNNNVTCNFRIGDVFRDVLTGTNTAFRSRLLSQLSNVNGSLQSLALSLGTVSADYKTVNNLYLNPSSQSVRDSVASQYTVDGSSSIAANTDRLFGTSRAGRESETAKALAELAREQLKAVITATLDPNSDFFGQDVTDILNDSDKFPAAVAQGGGGGALGGIARDVKRLSTNDWVSAVTNQLANNRASITNELARNRANITNQLAHMFDDEPNSVGRAMRNTANNTLSAANAAGSIDERLQRGITVAVVNEGNTSVGVHLDGPVNIDTTQWQTLSTPLGGLRDTVSAMWDGFYQFYNMGSSNYDWSHFFDMVQTFKEQNHMDLAIISSQSVTGDVIRIYDYLSGYQSNILYQIATSTNSLDWAPWFDKWDPFTDIVTNYYVEFNSSVPSSDIAADFLESGFDSERYSSLPWFQRVEVLLAMIADVRSNSVEVADIQEDMEQQAEDFRSLSTNVVGVSENVFGLFQYVQRFSNSLQSVFGDRAAPLTGDYVLLPAGSWIFDEPLTLRINPTIQNFCRLIMQCIWYLGFLVLLWVVVNWTWQKVVAVLRWLWSMFDV